MDTTVASAIEQARNRLTPLLKLTLNTLASDCALADGTVTVVNEVQGITAGSFIAVGTEVMYVPSPPSGRTFDVYRSQLGTTAPTTHTAGSVVESKTRFPRGLILQACLEEVRTLGPDLYQPLATTIDASAGVAGYDLNLVDQTDLYGVLRAYLRAVDTSYASRRIEFDYRPIGPADLCTTGTAALIFNSPIPDARIIDIIYAAPFDTAPFDVGTDLVADCKLTASMFDVVWLGAAYRMLQEAPRTQLATETEPRKSEEVPPGLITTARADLFKEYSRRKNEEVQKLLRRYMR